MENYARFLQESNLTLAEIQVKLQEKGDTSSIGLWVFVGILIVVVMVVIACFVTGIADYYILLFGQMAGILVMLRAHH